MNVAKCEICGAFFVPAQQVRLRAANRSAAPRKSAAAGSSGRAVNCSPWNLGRFTPGPWELGFEAEGDFDSYDSGRSVGWYTGGDVFSGEIVTARDENVEQDVGRNKIIKEA